MSEQKPLTSLPPEVERRAIEAAKKCMNDAPAMAERAKREGTHIEVATLDCAIEKIDKVTKKYPRSEGDYSAILNEARRQSSRGLY